MTDNFGPLEKKLGFIFKDRNLLTNAFVHRSYLNEHKDFYLPSNEKLEFLGDSVLSLITSYYLFIRYPALHEGDYTDIKAAIVRTESLGEAASDLGIGNYLLLSHGQDHEDGRHNINILADCFEAFIGAIFLEFGFKTTYEFVLKNLFANRLDTIVDKKLYLSPKSHLQEYTQAHYKVIPSYKVLGQKGPEHNKMFKIVVSVKNKQIATGVGHSKKEAEEEAAKKGLEKIKNVL